MRVLRTRAWMLFLLSLACSVSVGLPAGAQTLASDGALDCGPGGSLCQTTKYGLGSLPGFRGDLAPSVAAQGIRQYNHSDFGPDFGGSSYLYRRSRLGGLGESCGPERDFFPYPGQIFLRERTDCTPTSTGPICSGGTRAGQPCHVVPPNGTPAGYVNPFAPLECPGGTCVDSAGGCGVEIPISDGGGVPGGGWTPPSTTSDAVLTSWSGLAISVPISGFAFSSAHSAQTWGGSSLGFCQAGTTPGNLCRSDGDCGPGGTCAHSKGTCQDSGARCTTQADCSSRTGCTFTTCQANNSREMPSMGTRYLLPASRGGDGVRTYVRWDYGQTDPGLRVAQSTALRTHSDDSTFCCNTSLPNGCGTPPLALPLVYPVLSKFSCATTESAWVYALEDNLTNDWIFEAGRGSRFHSDRDHAVPGQVLGVCKSRRDIPCFLPAATARCTGFGTPFSCCTAAGSGTCGSECAAHSDTCDVTEPGHRAQLPTPARNSFGDPRSDLCASQMFVLRGTPDQGCTLAPPRLVDGDPGPFCRVFDYGRDRILDADCNGAADFADLCPFYSEWNPTFDTDGDCSDGPGGDCRGDECECGDQTGDGLVNVSDLVGINLAIFGAPTRDLCDTNNDVLCNVSDIVSANREIFVPDTAVCLALMSPRCGDNTVDPGEVCDNGSLNGDGCSQYCRIEPGFVCAGSPSVCTPAP